MRLVASLVVALFTSTSLLAAGSYHEVKYPPSDKPGELIFGVSYNVWIPDGVKTLRGVIVHQHGCGSGACKGGETAAFDLHWQALAKKWNCALLGPSFQQEDKQDCRKWCDPRNGSEKAFLRALDDLAKKSGHPELATVPWCLWGHSGGGFWASIMQTMHPDRIVAIWCRSGTAFTAWEKSEIPKPVITAAAYAVPVMLNPGGKEKTDARFAGAWTGSIAMLNAYRAKGAPIGFAPDPRTSHECGDSRYLAIPYFDACLAARLPDSGVKLKPIDLKAGVFAMPEATEYSKTAEKPEAAGWLPSEAFAKLWVEFVKTGATPDTTPPPSPTGVKVKDGVITWNAEADFESGLRGFILMRDGKELAQHPAKPVGRFGRPLFQTMSYHDTPEKPLPAMSFTDTTAKPGDKHEYQVVAINSVGLKSEPSISSELQRKLDGVAFEKSADAPGYSEGPTWRKGDVFFCSGALLRVTEKNKVYKYLELGPAGTVLRADGHLLVADNKHRAILDVSPEGTVGVLADRDGTQPLRSLNDLTIDAKGNIYWTDPEGSTEKTPIGRIYRLGPDGRVEMIGGGLMFPNGLDVDPASKFLYVIESQSKKILRYVLPDDRDLLGKPEVFYDLGGSGGDGCAFDADGNLWVADFHRPDTGKGRITVLSPAGKVLAHLAVPAKVVSNIAFGGPNHDEIFCTTGDPPGVFHAKVGLKGFAGHRGVPMRPLRMLNVVPMKPHPEAELVRQIFKPENLSERGYRPLIESFRDRELREKVSTRYPGFPYLAANHRDNLTLVAEIKRLGGTAAFEAEAPVWLREIAGDDALPVFNRFAEIVLNERSDGHATPVPKKDSDRITDAWLANNIGQQTSLRRLELSGTAITSTGLVHLKNLKNLEVLNICLTGVDDRGFEHLAGLTKMKRMSVCSSKITGSGFKHLAGMTQLESINLHSSPASDEGLEAISKLTNLRRLEIVHTNVTDAGLKHLANLKQLRQLHIASHDTTANGLPFLGDLKELYELDVYEKTASNATCEQIAKLPHLRKMMLIQGAFDDSGVKFLAKMDTLEEVTLNSAGVTDASIEVLSGLKHLRKLNLGGTKITAAGRKRLAEALPKTIIE